MNEKAQINKREKTHDTEREKKEYTLKYTINILKDLLYDFKYTATPMYDAGDTIKRSIMN